VRAGRGGHTDKKRHRENENKENEREVINGSTDTEQ